jgi:hypothetical protein
VTPEHLGATVQEVTPGQLGATLRKGDPRAFGNHRARDGSGQLGATVQEMAPGNWEPPTRGDSYAQADAASTFKTL